MQTVYRISYYAGVQTVRLLHRLRRLLTVLLSPLWVCARRTSAWFRLHRGRTLRAKLRTFFTYWATAAKTVAAAWKQHPVKALRQLLWLPIQAVRRYRHIVNGVATVAIVAVAVLVLHSTLQYWSKLSFALALTDDSGEVWGYVADESDLQAGIALATERLENTAGSLEAVTAPSVSLHMIPQAQILTQEEICDRLLNSTSVPLTEACGIYVNQVLRGVVNGRRQAQQVLTAFLEDNKQDMPKVEASFFDTVELVEGQYPVSRVISSEAMTQRLSAEETAVRVLLAGTVEYEIDVPFTIERVEDASQKEGYERVRVKGVNGKSLVTAQVTYLGGQEMSRTVLSTAVLQAPVTQIVAYGTKTKDQYSEGGGSATGRFVWPLETTRFISQPYGGFSGSHGGIDVWSRDMTGEGILAADGGTVLIAEDPKGTSYWSYGKYVVIDHGGGYQTWYAHCDELYVKTGDTVKQGQRIAAVGNTGRSTAPHLHFEVRLNGRTVNPMRFF